MSKDAFIGRILLEGTLHTPSIIENEFKKGDVLERVLLEEGDDEYTEKQDIVYKMVSSGKRFKFKPWDIKHFRFNGKDLVELIMNTTDETTKFLLANQIGIVKVEQLEDYNGGNEKVYSYVHYNGFNAFKVKQAQAKVLDKNAQTTQADRDILLASGLKDGRADRFRRVIHIDCPIVTIPE